MYAAKQIPRMYSRNMANAFSKPPNEVTSKVARILRGPRGRLSCEVHEVQVPKELVKIVPVTHKGNTRKPRKVTQMYIRGKKENFYWLHEVENFRRVMTTKATITDVPSSAAITMAPMAPGPRDPVDDNKQDREKRKKLCSSKCWWNLLNSPEAYG